MKQNQSDHFAIHQRLQTINWKQSQTNQVKQDYRAKPHTKAHTCGNCEFKCTMLHFKELCCGCLVRRCACLPPPHSQFSQPKNGKRTHVKIKLCECETDQCGCGEF